MIYKHAYNKHESFTKNLEIENDKYKIMKKILT